MDAINKDLFSRAIAFSMASSATAIEAIVVGVSYASNTFLQEAGAIDMEDSRVPEEVRRFSKIVLEASEAYINAKCDAFNID